MTISWPPLARWTQGINADEQALSWVPPTQVKDNIGYAITPSGHSELAAGILLAVSPNSKNKDAAYLYMQWLHSKQESLKNVMRPLGLRDPFRISHYESPEFQSLWPTAKDYLETHKEAVETGYADLAILETYKYWDTAGHAVVAAIGGEDRGRRWTISRPNGTGSPSRSGSTASVRPIRPGRLRRRPTESSLGGARRALTLPQGRRDAPRRRRLRRSWRHRRRRSPQRRWRDQPAPAASST